MTPAPAPAQAIDVHGLRRSARVVIDDAELRRDIRSLWADCPAPPGDPDFVIEVRDAEPWLIAVTPRDDGEGLPGETSRQRADDRPSAVAATCAAINVTFATQTPLLAVHAAVLSKNGTTLLVPGHSGAGKTTLTVALLQRGWAYATDEAFATDWDADTAYPYPRPLGVSDWTAKALGVAGGVTGPGERFLRAADLGASVITEPVVVRHVVLLDRSGEDSPPDVPSLRSVHRVDALQVLMRESFTHYRHPEQALIRLADVVRAARPWQLRYDDPAAAADLLDRDLAGA